MQALNQPTAIVLGKMIERFKTELVEGKKTPYDTLVEKRKELHPECGPGEWPEEAREPAIEAMAMWVAVQLGGMLAMVINEINDAGRGLVRGDEAAKKAAFELAQSMGFIETVFKTWFETIDVQAIAEGLFEAGEEAEKNPTKPAKKAEKNASSLIDELMAKYKASNN